MLNEKQTKTIEKCKIKKTLIKKQKANNLKEKKKKYIKNERKKEIEARRNRTKYINIFFMYAI